MPVYLEVPTNRPVSTSNRHDQTEMQQDLKGWNLQELVVVPKRLKDQHDSRAIIGKVSNKEQ